MVHTNKSGFIAWVESHLMPFCSGIALVPFKPTGELSDFMLEGSMLNKKF